jgi:hypothetical protein
LVIPLVVLAVLGMYYALGAGLVMLGFVLHAVYVADRRGTSADRSRAQRQLVGLVSGAALAAALGTVMFLEFKSVTLSACEAAERARTRLARKDAYGEVQARAWMARRFGAPLLERCFSEASYQSGGACPSWPLDAEPCQCARMKWPNDVHCGAKRAFCGCLAKGGACRSSEDCCSGQCNGDRCAGGYWSASVRRLHCVEP